MRFKQVSRNGMTGLVAHWSKWQFLILHEWTGWTVSYRLTDPKGQTVSASSTIRGPYDTRPEAELAAEEMRRDLRALQ